MSLPDTVSVTAMFTTDGSTRLTSGAKLAGVPRACAPIGAAGGAGAEQQGKRKGQAAQGQSGAASVR